MDVVVAGPGVDVQQLPFMRRRVDEVADALLLRLLHGADPVLLRLVVWLALG